MTTLDAAAAFSAVLRQALRPEVDDDAYWSAIAELRRSGSEVVFPLAMPLARDERDAVRALVPDVLRYFEPHTQLEASVRLIVDMLRVESAPTVIASLACAFVDLRHEAAQEVLPPLLRHHDADVRVCAIQGLLSVLAPSNIEHFIFASRDESESVRNWATFGLRLAVEAATEEGFSRDPVVTALGERLADRHSETRAEAVLALAKLHDARVATVLMDEFRALPEWDHFTEAAEILADPRLLPILEDLAKRHPEEADSWVDAIAACKTGVPYRR